MIFEFDIFFFTGEISCLDFNQNYVIHKGTGVLLLKTTSVELEGRAGQHGVCALAWGAMEVLASWSCCGRVGSKRAAGGRTWVKLR